MLQVDGAGAEDVDEVDADVPVKRKMIHNDGVHAQQFYAAVLLRNTVVTMSAAVLLIDDVNFCGPTSDVLFLI